MSLHGGTPPPQKKKRPGLGGFKPARGGRSGSSSTPPSSGSSWRPPSSGSSWTPPTSRSSWTPPSSGASFRPPPPASGSTYTPRSTSSGSSARGASPFGGFKFPGLGGGPGGGGIWGAEPTGPGFTANWTESTRTLVAAGAGALILLGAGLLVFGLMKGGQAKTDVAVIRDAGITKFVPPTASAGGKTQMSVAFTDGTSADLLYDPSLDLASLGVNVADSGTLGKFTRGGRQFQIDHGGASFVGSHPTPPPQGLPGAAGGASVPVLPAPSPTQGNYLDFKFGDWHVGVWEGIGDELMSPSDDQAWAANLVGTPNASGFLVLTAKDPLKLTPFGTAGGPYMTIGDIYSTGVLLTPGACTVPSGNNVANNANGVPVRISQNAPDHYEGDLCLKDQKMEALIYGSQTFVRGVTDSLELRNVKAGPAR
ncbi:MAG: hypothetical protein QOJ93_1703 [Actinomycetota bacterium]|nr:hypothetical protein [Actinomycetota bacterium]